jgi:hypothetical protein
MYVAFAVFFLLFAGLMGLDLIGGLISPGSNSGDTLDHTPVWLLLAGLIWYWVMAAGYLCGLFFGLFNIARLIRRPTIHFYASCAICITELGIFLALWFWPY